MIKTEEKAIKPNRIARARVDLQDRRMRDTAEALLSVRLQLAQVCGQNFRAFDTAFARYFSLANPGINIRQRHPELFKNDNEFIGDLVDWSETGIGIAIEVGAAVLPGLNLLYKYGSRLSKRAAEWLEKRGKHVLQGLDALTADQIMQKLPTYLGADIYDILETKKNQRLVIIFDTHEALWRDQTQSDMTIVNRADSWIRLLVQENLMLLNVASYLAQQIGNQGRYAEAEAEFREIWQIMRKPEVLGEQHKSHLRTRYWLARCCDGQSRPREADELLDGLLAEMQDRLDGGHNWISELQEYMAQRGK